MTKISFFSRCLCKKYAHCIVQYKAECHNRTQYKIFIHVFVFPFAVSHNGRKVKLRLSKLCSSKLFQRQPQQCGHIFPCVKFAAPAFRKSNHLIALVFVFHTVNALFCIEQRDFVRVNHRYQSPFLHHIRNNIYK